jgi:predicted Zn-dependent peptidase
VKRVTERFNLNQAKLSLGFSRGPLSEDEYFSFIVANSIFGSGVHSKLFNNVREKLSLAYYAFSRTERVKNAVIVGMGIEEENFKKAYDETLYQLNALKRGEISDDEFNGAVMFLKNNARAVLDSQGAMIMYNLSNCALGLDISIDEYTRKIDEVTKESCAESFKDLALDTVYFLCGKENENA